MGTRFLGMLVLRKYFWVSTLQVTCDQLVGISISFSLNMVELSGLRMLFDVILNVMFS